MSRLIMIRWKNNYAYYEDADAAAGPMYYYEAANVDSLAAAIDAARAQLAQVAGPTVGYLSEAESVEGASPLDDYDIGDAVDLDVGTGTLVRVKTVGFTVSTDAEGYAKIISQFNTLADENNSRIAKLMKATAAGALGGKSASVRSGVEFDLKGADLGQIKIDTFAQVVEAPLDDVTGISGVPHPVRLSRVIFQATANPNGSIISVMKNNSPLLPATIIVPGGTLFALQSYNDIFGTGDKLQIAYVLGTGTEKATVQPIGSVVP